MASAQEQYTPQQYGDGRLPLPEGTILDGCYEIQRVVGSGGFAITYAAVDTNLGTTVAIKEYYPAELGHRDDTFSIRARSASTKDNFDQGKENFLREARTLARFNHPNIVRVVRVFEANDTAYITMRFEGGTSFEAWLNGLGRRPNQQELDGITSNLLSALEDMHTAGLLHRDIAPDNIIIRDDGTPVLLDFGAAKRATAERTRTIAGIVKLGYSPQEQYSVDSSHQGPWSDFYALGGSLYRAITGFPPPEAPLRFGHDTMRPAAEVGAGQYRADFLGGIDWCLKLRPAERPQSVSALQARMGLASPTTDAIPLVNTVRETTGGSGSLATAGKWLLIVSAVVLITSGGYVGVNAYLRDLEVKREQALFAERERADVERLKAEEQARQQRLAIAEEEMRRLTERQRVEAEEEQRKREEAVAQERRKREEDDRRVAEEKRRAAEEKRAADEKRLAEERRIADEKRRADDDKKRLIEEKRIADEKRVAEEKRMAEEKRQAEERRVAEEKRRAEDEKRKADDDKKRIALLEIERRKESKPTGDELNQYTVKVGAALQKVQCFNGLNGTKIGDVQTGIDRFAERMRIIGRQGPPRLEIASASVGQINDWLEIVAGLKEQICPVDGLSGASPSIAAPAAPPAYKPPPVYNPPAAPRRPAPGPSPGGGGPRAPIIGIQ